MRVVICGAGQVGFGIAERLAGEGNDVAVIDSAPNLIASITDTLDVRGYVGHGSHPETLEAAGAADADMLIAVTFSDEVNMVACTVAHALFEVPVKIARVRAQNYLDPRWRDLFVAKRLPIDVVISPEIEVGEMVMRRLALPGSTDTLTFADDAVVVTGIHCDADCPVLDTPLRQLTDLFPDLGAIIVGINRKGRVFVPRSHDSVEADDQVYVVGRSDQTTRILSIFGHDEPPAQRIIVAGGGKIGHFVARELEARNPRARVKVIEASRERALAVSETLGRTIVLHGSSLDRALLEEADVSTADTLLAVTNDDQVNILTSVMAKKLGAKRCVSLINNASWPRFTRDLGIDALVNPRQITVSRVLQHVRRGRILGVQSLLDGAAEVIEAEALETSPLSGKPLRATDLPEGIRIGAVIRKNQILFPDGGLVVQPHDRLVVFAIKERVKQVEQLFRVSLEFF